MLFISRPTLVLAVCSNEGENNLYNIQNRHTKNLNVWITVMLSQVHYLLIDIIQTFTFWTHNVNIIQEQGHD